MLPDSAQQVSKLRTQFYRSFADSLGCPVSINREKSYASTLPRLSWTDDQGRLNYLCMYAHSAPDGLLPDRPLVLRIGVNLGAEPTLGASPGRGRRRYNWTCQFYLTLLAAEVQGALPWITKALNQPQGLDLETLDGLPYSLDGNAIAGQNNSLWSDRALQTMAQPRSAPGVSPDYMALLP